MFKNQPQSLHDLKQSVQADAMGIAGNAVANFNRRVGAPEYLI